jgi:FKBP-type peptidyl-prolyl cis-trans isomerase
VRGQLLAASVPSLSSASEDEGIAVEILERGDPASPTPQRAQTVVVDYTLWVGGFEKKLVDSSKGSALPPKLPSPFKFNVGVGQVIPGWDRTVMEMHVGEKRRVVIPSSLGYGDKGVGPIPGKASLYFEIELLELKPMKTFSPEQQKWLDEHPMR